MNQASSSLARAIRSRDWPTGRADREDYLITETAATQILTYQPQQVPDLLQTQEYARAVVRADPALPPGTQDIVLESMLTRQQVILADQGPELAVIIGEGALHQVGGPEVMRAQLARLAELSDTYPQVTIQVLPFACGAHPAGGSGPLSILRFAGAPDLGVVHLPGPTGVCLTNPSDVATHARAFTQLKASALTRATAQLLRDMAAGRNML
jgi:hypothetical protein